MGKPTPTAEQRKPPDAPISRDSESRGRLVPWHPPTHNRYALCKPPGAPISRDSGSRGRLVPWHPPTYNRYALFS
jgi:hypothetical protein